jgi:hypothetical protein
VVALSALSVKPRRPFSHEDVAKYLTVSRDNIVVAAFSAIVLVSISFFSRVKITKCKGRRGARKNIVSKGERKKETRGMQFFVCIAGEPRDMALIMSAGARGEHVIARKMSFARGERAGVTSARDTFFSERSALRDRQDLWRAKPRIRDREISLVLPTTVTGCLLIVQHA